MNPELESWQNAALFSDGKVSNFLIRQIVLTVWPDTELLSARDQAWRYGCVKDVIGGHATPALSRMDRAAILAAAKPVLEAR